MFVSNTGLDLVLRSLVLGAGLIGALAIREYARAVAGRAVGDKTPVLAGRLRPDRRMIDPLGSVVFPLLASVSGAIAYAWAIPISYDVGHPGPRRRVLASGLAGSAANIVVAAVLVRVVPTSGSLTANIGGLFITANLSMAVMHLIPIPHLDGGRILATFLSPSGRARLVRLEPWSIGIAFGLMFFSRWIGNQPFIGLIRWIAQVIT